MVRWIGPRLHRAGGDSGRPGLPTIGVRPGGDDGPALDGDHDAGAAPVIDVPKPDPALEPDGFVVEVADRVRIHFLDWGGWAAGARPGYLLIHGLGDTAWHWAPVARRLVHIAPVVAMDLRGHGLSDAPTEGYGPDDLAEDVVAVAEGSGLLASGGDTAGAPGHPRIVLAGHGYGAIVAAWAAARLGARCAALVLVDGGIDDVRASTGLEPDEFERELAEPPEVFRSMETFLADRESFDPASWDADQERAARETVVEVPAGRVVPAIRPHAFSASVEAMFAYRPAEMLATIAAPVTVLLAASGADDPDPGHAIALARLERARRDAGRDPVALVRWPEAGHNLMRYRPAEVTAALLAAREAAR